MTYCRKCGRAVYFDLDGVAHCICCDATKDLCPSCGGKGYREVRSRMKACGLCAGTGLPPTISEVQDAGEARR